MKSRGSFGLMKRIFLENLSLLNLQESETTGVDNVCSTDHRNSLFGAFKVFVDMTVDKPGGLSFVNQIDKTLEPHVAKILTIANMPRRSMGDHKVQAFFSPYGKPHFEDDFFHLSFGVLVFPAIVPHGAFKAHDVQGFELHDPSVYVVTPHWVGRGVPDIVVALYVKQRFFKSLPQKGKVFRSKVSAGDDQVHRFKALGFYPFYQRFVGKVRYCQYFYLVRSRAVCFHSGKIPEPGAVGKEEEGFIGTSAKIAGASPSPQNFFL